MAKLCCERCFAVIRGRSGTARLCHQCAGTRPRERAISRYRNLAHQFVTIAIRYGDLSDLKNESVACVDCGKRAQEYEHRDYRKPMDVQPVCKRCNQARGEADGKYVPQVAA